MLGGRDLEPLHPLRQRLLALGLDQQMNVIVLEAEMNDPEVFSPRRGERRLANRLVDAAAAQVTEGVDDPQRDVHGIALVEERPRLVR